MKKLLYLGLILIIAALIAALAVLFFRSSESKPAKLKVSLQTSSQTNLPEKEADLVIPVLPDTQVQAKQIQDLRTELQAIMNLNQSIQARQTASASQILRIQEQAAIHEKILTKIQSGTDSVSDTSPSREALLAQEKLRLIREATLKSKKMLEAESKPVAQNA